VATTCAAVKLLQLFLEMKEASALLIRECGWMTGVPFVPLEVDEQDVAVGSAGVLIEGMMDDNKDVHHVGMEGSEGYAKWNEFEMIQDFGLQCFSASKEAIHRLTTERLAESANLTLQDAISSVSEEGKRDEMMMDQQGSPISDIQNDDSNRPLQQQTSPSFTNAEIGRCYKSQPRSSCWESSRLHCPDYTWADDCITLCQRLLKNLSKHKLISSLGGPYGWSRYVTNSSSSAERNPNIVLPPTYASCSPHPFPSLEAVHTLKYLVSDLVTTTLPAHLNQFCAAVESNAVVSKRLYLVKCEYRAPIRAFMESWMALKAAPKLELVERYLREFHATSSEGGGGNHAPTSGKSNATRRKNSNNSVTPALQAQRDSLEKLIADKWKDPSFLEALQLERLCERLEMEMACILLPLSHVAAEIMDSMRGRIRAVAILTNDLEENDTDDTSDDESAELNIEEILGWKDVPHMRELLKCLKTILCRKGGADESSGIRPLLLDLQGVPRRNDDLVDLSIEVPFYKHPSRKRSVSAPEEKWYYLDQFIQQVETLLKLIAQPNTPFLIGDEKGTRRWQELVQNTEVWDSDLFRAQYQDWFDMVTRQHELNNTNDGSSLAQISESLRAMEIELSIAMASAPQLELVRQRLEALLVDKKARYLVLAQIINDVSLRELNENIVVLPTTEDMSTDFPELSGALGLFGTQMLASEEVLPI